MAALPQITYPVQKRNGALADFDAQKIVDAIQKAALATGNAEDSEEAARRVGAAVVRMLDEHFFRAEKPVSVEDIQDLVEIALMRAGKLKMAKAYILYRAEHKKQREQKQEKIEEAVRHRSFKMLSDEGNEKIFDPTVWEHAVSRLAVNLKKVNAEAVVSAAVKLLYDGMRESELPMAILNAARGLMEQHPEYSFLASRLLWNQTKTDILGADFTDQTERDAFAKYVDEGIEYGLLDPTLAKTFDLKKLSEALQPERDELFQYLGARTIFDRYLLKTPNPPQRVFELPQWLFMRVAMGLSLNEKDPTARAISFYDVLSRFEFVSSTPTLFNAGTTHPQMSSCYLNTVADSLTGIFKNYADVAQLSKFAGGIGTDWTPIRSTGAMIRGTNGASQGVIPFLKIFNDVCLAVNQGGKRKGAMAAYLEVWHSDVEEFLELRKNTGDERRRTHDVHPVLWIPDLFMKRVLADEEWTLFSPSEAPELHESYGKKFEEAYEKAEKANLPSARKIKAKDLWRKSLTMLYETGHPWVTFKDPCNIRSPQDHVGVVHNSNLCTEITLNTSETETAVCNLGSLNLAQMVTNGKLDREKIKTTVQTAVRMLDNVIDLNFYPTAEAKNSNMLHRPVGLGLMGYHDALHLLGIPFESAEHVEFADQSMEIISFEAIAASADLAKERGTYESYKGSKWDRGIFPIDSLEMLEWERGQAIETPKTAQLDWAPVREAVKKHGMRNSNVMAIAPTATISNITGVTPCVEPLFRNMYMKENLSGNFLVMNHFLVEDLEKLNLWTPQIRAQIKLGDGSVADIAEVPDQLKKKYRETFEIAPKYLLEAAARRQKWIDQACSTNVFLRTKSGKILSETYMQAWKLGLKTTYYLRTLAASQIEKTVEVPVAAAEAPKPSTEEAAAAPAPTVVAAAAPAAAAAGAQPTPKLCSVLDPSCEACQ